MAFITRRRSVLGAALLVVSGCLYIGNSPTRSLTHVRSAELSSATPPLGAFMLRVAASDLSLDAEQARLTSELSRDANAAIQPIDEARAVFIEVLVRAVMSGRFDPVAAEYAADVVHGATRNAAPRLLVLLVKLHHALEPSQREALVARVRGRFDGWSSSWRGETPSEHPWLATFAEPAFPRDNASVDDAVRSARRWTKVLTEEVEAKAAQPTLGRDEQRELVDRLRK